MKISYCGHQALGQPLGVAWGCAAPPARPLPPLHGVPSPCPPCVGTGLLPRWGAEAAADSSDGRGRGRDESWPGCSFCRLPGPGPATQGKL